MLMAAGLGTRLRPFTDRLPKPLLPVLGVPVAQFAIDGLTRAGVTDIVANVHHLAAVARAGLEKLDYWDARLEISDESTRLLGSAGGIRHALPKLGEGPFFLANADVLCDINYAALACRHQQLREQFGVTMTLTILPGTPGGAAYRELRIDYKRGLIRALGVPTVGKPYFAGVAVIEPEAVRALPANEPADFVQQVLAPAVAQGKVGAYLASVPWTDIGSPLLWHQAHFTLLNDSNEGKLPAGWKRRLEQSLRKISPQGWVSRRAPGVLMVTGWEEPFFWSPYGDQSDPPARLGSQCILYGAPPQGCGLSRGIGLGGDWVDLPLA